MRRPSEVRTVRGVGVDSTPVRVLVLILAVTLWVLPSLPRFRLGKSCNCPVIPIVTPEIPYSAWFITWTIALVARTSFIFAVFCAFMSSSLWRIHTSFSCATFTALASSVVSSETSSSLHHSFISKGSVHIRVTVGGHALQRLFLLQSRQRVQDIPLPHKLKKEQ